MTALGDVPEIRNDLVRRMPCPDRVARVVVTPPRTNLVQARRERGAGDAVRRMTPRSVSAVEWANPADAAVPRVASVPAA